MTGELRSSVSGPSAVPLWKPKDDIETLVREDPYVVDQNTGAVVRRAELLTADNFEQIDFKRNANGRTLVLNGKFDIKISELSSAAIGATFNVSINQEAQTPFSYTATCFPLQVVALYCKQQRAATATSRAAK